LLNSNISQSFEGLSIEEINNTILLNNSFKKELKIIDLEFNCIISKLNPDDNNYVAIFNDITEIKQIDRLKTDMVRMVSHELKNPLASIRICAENILFMKESNISVEHANRILNSTEYLVDTITNFLNLSKLENNLIEINITQTNIIDIINKSIELHSSQTERKNIVIKLEKDEIIPDVLVDDKLILIVMNVLISNAIKYSHNDSEILLKINAEGGKVRLSIIDYGIGIPENDLDRIFEKFYRSINNKMMNIEGTGLGLTIIKRILEIHNSNIIVKSEYGKGSTFTFEL
ncbi:MAG: ATP-binding protein, partial [Cyanobacteriota bacterium]